MMSNEGVRILRKDPVLGQIIDSVGNYSLKRRNNRFAVLVESIIYQQLAPKAADAIFHRFKDLYPKFPTAEELMHTKRTKLRAAGISSMKVEYLKDLAAKVESGEVSIKLLPKLSDGEVIDHLRRVKGIGRWTAEMFLIFSLGRTDVFPVHDLGLRKGIQQIFSLEELPSPEEVEKIGDRWKPYRTIATWYIWKSMRKFDGIG